MKISALKLNGEEIHLLDGDIEREPSDLYMCADDTLRPAYSPTYLVIEVVSDIKYVQIYDAIRERTSFDAEIVTKANEVIKTSVLIASIQYNKFDDIYEYELRGVCDQTERRT
ncbi:hypothetical protein [Bacillus thuringiensis]|uniref:hypothetical protein n=1 Tax=Bacillus thuringiensis TaxID=1428 RepID=UPI000C01B249|nr:hypothetical protein [Bacillus thuringiensis]PFS88271.1 hypothetical protein COK53_22990 [Bacillus thuringiensis]